MDDLVADTEHALDEDLASPDGEGESLPGDGPEVYTGEVPPEEEIGGTEPDPAAADSPVLATAAPEGNGDEVRAESRAPTAATQPTPDRPIKIVLTLRPGRTANEPGSALIAVGSDGHEPAFRYLDSADLAAALAAVPEIVAAAVAAWSRRPEPGLARVRPAPVGAAPAEPVPEPTASARTQPAPQSRRARSGEPSSDQPSLFG